MLWFYVFVLVVYAGLGFWCAECSLASADPDCLSPRKPSPCAGVHGVHWQEGSRNMAHMLPRWSVSIPCLLHCRIKANSRCEYSILLVYYAIFQYTKNTILNQQPPPAPTGELPGVSYSDLLNLLKVFTV